MNGIGAKKNSPRDWTEAWRKVEDEAECRACGYDRELDPAHTIHRSQGGGMSAAAIVPLCRACHDAFDSDSLDLIPYLSREEELEAVRVVGLARAYRMLGGFLEC